MVNRRAPAGVFPWKSSSPQQTQDDLQEHSYFKEILNKSNTYLRYSSVYTVLDLALFYECCLVLKSNTNHTEEAGRKEKHTRRNARWAQCGVRVGACESLLKDWMEWLIGRNMQAEKRRLRGGGGGVGELETQSWANCGRKWWIFYEWKFCLKTIIFIIIIIIIMFVKG